MTPETSPSPQLPVAVGQCLAGRYRIDGTLAQGGSAVVFEGTDVETRSRVAVKLLLPEVAKTPSSKQRFERELRVLRHLRSPCVVRVLDDGALQSGEPFMVLEYLSGRTLKDVLRADGPLPVPEAVDYVLQACEVLAEAHVAGVVHRDVKPENLFLVGTGPDACVKVLDFGLSKAESGAVRDEREPSITRGHEVMGSPYYMAPEQLLSSHHVDRFADIWSVGVVLYELLAGRPPFVGETVERLRANVMMMQPRSLRAERAEVPEELERIVMRCLEKVPEERFKGLAVLAASLVPFGTERAKESAARIRALVPANGPPPLPPSSSPLPLEPAPAMPVAAGPGLSRVRLGDKGPPQVHHDPFPSARKPASPSWTARSHRRARQRTRSMLLGVGVAFFALGLAIGVVLSVWQHQRPARQPAHASVR